MRYIVVDDQEVSLGVIEAALKQADAAYLIERDAEADSEGVLTYEGAVYGEVEVNRPGDEIFDEEIGELKESVEDAEGEKKSEVLSALSRAKAIVAVRVLDQGREPEATLGRIDPLWRWLFARREGLLQADGEGYYNASGLVLEVE